jgi:uncharacterized membrane protein YebE (DUF533 family)
MAFKDMLDQMLASGKDLTAQAQAYAEQFAATGQAYAQQAASKGEAYAEENLNLPPAGPERDALLSNLGKGALAGGALVAILGTRFGRKLGGTAVALGGLGLLGKVATDAYRTWKADQAGDTALTGTPVNELGADAAERRSMVLLKAMIAAANADGHIDEAERASIQSSMKRLGLDQDVRMVIDAELAMPQRPAEIAAAVDSPETAAEIYLASLFVIDPDDPRERAYLDELATALRIEPGFARQLETTAYAG